MSQTLSLSCSTENSEKLAWLHPIIRTVVLTYHSNSLEFMVINQKNNMANVNYKCYSNSSHLDSGYIPLA